MYHTTRLPWLSERLRSVVTVHAHTLGRTGTGFVVRADGHLLTAAHCVVDDSGVPFGDKHETEEDITVAFLDGSTYSVQLVGFDMHADVAVLRLPPDARRLSPIPVRRHTYPQPGDTCVVVGNIFGQDPRSVAVGAVRSGRWKDPHGLSLLSTVMTDVVTGAGTSGGPILDTAGHLVALHTAAYGAPPSVCTTCGLPFRSANDLHWHQQQQSGVSDIGAPAVARSGTTQLGGGVVSKILWSIYQAILRHEDPSTSLTKWTVDQRLATITHVDGHPVGQGTVHDVTWLLGPGEVVVGYEGMDDARVPPVPLPHVRDVAVGSTQHISVVLSVMYRSFSSHIPGQLHEPLDHQAMLLEKEYRTVQPPDTSSPDAFKKLLAEKYTTVHTLDAFKKLGKYTIYSVGIPNEDTDGKTPKLWRVTMDIGTMDIVTLYFITYESSSDPPHYPELFDESSKHLRPDLAKQVYRNVYYGTYTELRVVDRSGRMHTIGEHVGDDRQGFAAALFYLTAYFGRTPHVNAYRTYLQTRSGQPIID